MDTTKELEAYAFELGLDARIGKFHDDFVIVGLYGYPLAHMPCLGSSVEAAKEALRARALKDAKYITTQEVK